MIPLYTDVRRNVLLVERSSGSVYGPCLAPEPGHTSSTDRQLALQQVMTTHLRNVPGVTVENLTMTRASGSTGEALSTIQAALTRINRPTIVCVASTDRLSRDLASFRDFAAFIRAHNHVVLVMNLHVIDFREYNNVHELLRELMGAYYWDMFRKNYPEQYRQLCDLYRPYVEARQRNWTQQIPGFQNLCSQATFWKTPKALQATEARVANQAEFAKSYGTDTFPKYWHDLDPSQLPRRGQRISEQTFIRLAEKVQEAG